MRQPSASALRPIKRAILDWYAGEHRALPWRSTRDPYAILVSEVMLQQTQAARVAVRFPRFLTRFPSIAALAVAPTAAVLAEWSGLGYNRRALSLHRAASEIDRAGWPTRSDALEALPGVGRYTARAVASLAFGQPVGVVDTNVRRWLIRRLGLEPTSEHGGGAALQRLADAFASAGADRTALTPDRVAAWTHASMELGAVVCRPRRPKCDACPVARGCPARGRAERVRVARQPAYAGSARAYRGALMRALADTPARAMDRSRLVAQAAESGMIGEPLAEPRIALAIAALERDGLAHADGELVRLGPRPPADQRSPYRAQPAAPGVAARILR